MPTLGISASLCKLKSNPWRIQSWLEKRKKMNVLKKQKMLRFLLLAFSLEGLEVWRSSKANTKRGCNFPTLFSFYAVLVFYKCQHNITFLKWKLHFLCYFASCHYHASKQSSSLDKKVLIVSNAVKWLWSILLWRLELLSFVILAIY